MSDLKTDKSTTRARSKRGDNRARALVAAAQTLNRQGISNASLPLIAERLGVSRATLYYYFEDQEDLVFQTYRRTCELFAQHLSEAEAKGGECLEIIERFIDGILAPDTPEIAALSDMAYLGDTHRATISGLFAASLALA